MSQVHGKHGRGVLPPIGVERMSQVHGKHGRGVLPPIGVERMSQCMANTGEECFLLSVLSECLKCIANTGEECFLPSVLLCVRPGATLFEDLRTAHNQIHPTFQAAAQALQCCGPFTGVYKAMGDARCTGMPAQL
eukprot:366221-Chlamydomonas_euryale.AAC.13